MAIVWFCMGMAAVLLSAVYFAGRRRMRRAGIHLEKDKGLAIWFYPAGYQLFLWSRGFQERQGKRADAGLKQALARTLAKEQVEEEYQLFQVKRFTALWMFVFLGVAAGFTMGIKEYQDSRQSLAAVQRPEAGESAERYSLEVEGSWKGRRKVQITVNPREYSDAQLDELFEEAYQQAILMLPGENPSLEEVGKPLSFLEAAGGGLEISWKPEDRALIDRRGNVIAEEIPEQGLVTSVALTLSYGEREETYQIPVRLVPEKYTEEELWARELEEALKREEDMLESQEDGGQQNMLALPGQLQGSKVSFYEKSGYSKGVLLALTGVLAAVFSFTSANQKLKEKQRERELQMQADYPDILSKLTVYIGAGLTVRGAWGKLAENYQKVRINQGASHNPCPVGKKRNFKKISRNLCAVAEKRYAYEEILYTYREMQGGQPELQAYKNFGKRCGLSSYRKLSVLLEQNLRRGGRDLKDRLKSEMEEAFSERIHQAKRDGEKASAKLMIPMFLMFLLVLFLIMAPALMSFSIF